MEKRKLGKSQLYVNAVGLGCMGFSHASGDPTDNETAIKTLRQAYDMGYDFFDTAQDVYPAMRHWSERHLRMYAIMSLLPPRWGLHIMQTGL